MSETVSASMKWVRADQAASVGNQCVQCSTHAHPEGFYRPTSDVAKISGYGYPHFCAGCADDLVRFRGGADAAQLNVLHGQLDEMAVANETLEVERDHARDNIHVPAKELIDWVIRNYPLVADLAEALASGKVVNLDAERAKRRPNEPVPTTKKAS